MKVVATCLFILILLHYHEVASSFVVSSPYQKAKQVSTITTSSRSKIMSLSSSSKEGGGGPVLNLGFVGQLAANQALIGSTIWTGGPGAQVLARDANFDNPAWLVFGLLGVIPLIALSRRIETSESPLFATLNLSTNMTVLRLFGGKTQPILALMVSALLCGLTGLVEEVTFRGEVLPTLAQWSVTNLGAVGNGAVICGTVLSTVIFALLHINPLGLLQGLDKESTSDTFVLFVFQLCTGTIFAFLYLSTQNLAVPIVAHTLYDFYTFYNTHFMVTGQMAYAEQESLLGPNNNKKNNAIEQKWINEKGEQFVQDVRQTFYLMDSNKDGVVSRKELRVGLFSYGIKLSKFESETALVSADIDESGEIDYNEFLEFCGKAGSPGKAIKQSILGIQ